MGSHYLLTVLIVIQAITCSTQFVCYAQHQMLSQIVLFVIALEQFVLFA